MISRRIGTPPTSNNGNSINSNNSSSKSSKESSFTMVSSIKRIWSNMTGYMNSTRLMVLVILCMQNSMFTILRRYSLGVLKEEYSKVRFLLVNDNMLWGRANSTFESWFFFFPQYAICLQFFSLFLAPLHSMNSCW